MEQATIWLYPFRPLHTVPMTSNYMPRIPADMSDVITGLRGLFLSSSTLFRTKKDITRSDEGGFTTISRALPQSLFCILLWTFLID